MGYIAAPFAGNVPLFDLLAADERGFSIPIQVKAINGPSWQYRADTFVKIKHVHKSQYFLGKTLLPNPDLICIYVFLHKDAQPDEFFIFRLRELQDLTVKNYFPNGRSRVRPKNSTSTHCAVCPKEIESFRDNWGLIRKSFEERRA
jgi:hypothetical protein